ncbi:MAG: DUF2726 domain-containing protein [Anaerolineales bacterium]|nr:DUF2726 domain-containing protein [Anaerolineales bacterium]
MELNDATHTRFDRRSSDDFKRQVCQEIGLPLIWIKVGERLTDDDIHRLIVDNLVPPMAGDTRNPQ